MLKACPDFDRPDPNAQCSTPRLLFSHARENRELTTPSRFPFPFRRDNKKHENENENENHQN